MGDAMREYVTFSSAAFSKAPRPHYINRVCQCEDLALWRQTSLNDAIPGARLTTYQEDFGWVVEVQPPGRPRPIMVVAADLDDDENPEAFAVYVEGPPAEQSLFRRSKPPDPAVLAERDEVITALDRAVQGNATITAVQWWAEGPMAGDPSEHPEEA